MADNIKPSFIVGFKDGVSKEQIQKYIDSINSNGGKVTHEWNGINAFAANIPQSFLGSLQGDDLIKYIEPNQEVTIQ